MILVKHFCPLLELAPGVVDQHIHCRNTAPRTVSSSQHHPRTTHKEIVLHNQLQEKRREKLLHHRNAFHTKLKVCPKVD